MFKRFGSACILALGIAFAGYFVAYSIGHFHNFNRYVSVKGLAEKTVQANEALMTLRFSANGNSLQAVYTAMQHSQQAITSFLTQHGIQRQRIMIGSVSVNTNPQDSKQKTPKYTAYSSINVTTPQVAVIRSLNQKTSDLIKHNVLLSATSVSYRFTALNTIKAGMLTTATAQAKQAAQTFAHNAHARVGSIRQASQGLFTITDADGGYGNNDIKKIVRVVVHVQYFIKD